MAGGDVIALVQTVKGGTFPEACHWMGGDQGLSEADQQKLRDQQRAREDQAKRDADAKAKADRADMANILQGLKPGAGTPVQAYLEGRGLRAGLIHLGWINPDGAPADWPRNISFHPGLEAFAGPKGARVKVGRLPAMIALGRDASGAIVCVHRTFLDVDPDTGAATKAGLPEAFLQKHAERRDEMMKSWNAKQVIGPVGAAERGVYLGEIKSDDPKADSCQLVAEGIENALAVAASGVVGSYSVALNLGRMVGTVRENAHGNSGFTFADQGRAFVLLGDNDLSPTPAFPNDPAADGAARFGGLRRAGDVMGRALKRLSASSAAEGAVALPPPGLDFNDWLLGRAQLDVEGAL